MPSSPAAQTPLRDLVSSAVYFAKVSDVALRIEPAADVGAVVDLLKQATRLIGADVASFLSCIQDDEYRTCRFLLACDPAWFAEYDGRRWGTDDPWLQYCRTHAEPILARDIPVRTAAQADIVQLAEQFGFRSTVVVPVPVGSGLTRLGMLCLGAADPERFSDDTLLPVGIAALPLAAELSRWCTARAREELVQSARFSAEDLLLLDLQRQGLSTKQMVGVTKMSAKSINSRFQRINARLGVPNRKAAARRAAEYGLI